MPNIETLHGDEEIIEACSARYYETLGGFVTNGVLNREAAEPHITRITNELEAEYGSRIEVHHGFADAVQTFADYQRQVDWM